MALGIGLGLGKGPYISRGVTFGAEALALFARMPTQPVEGFKEVVDGAITNFKNASLWANGALWSRMDQALIFPGALDTANGYIDWRPSARNASGAASSGTERPFLTPTGIVTGYYMREYINTGFNPSTHRVSLQATSGAGSIGVNRDVFQYDPQTAITDGYLFGSTNPSLFAFGHAHKAVNGNNNAYGGVSSASNVVIGVGNQLKGNLTIRRTGTSVSVRKNAATIGPATIANTGFANFNVYIGGWNSNGTFAKPCYNEFPYLIITDYLTDAEVDTLSGLMDAFKAAAMPYTGANYKRVICDGNSLTAGTGGGTAGAFSIQIRPLVGAEFEFINVGVGGQTTLQMISDAATQIDVLYNQYNTKNIIAAFEGYNHAASATQEQMYSSIVQYYQERRAAGWEVVVCTIPGSSTAGRQTKFDYVNTQIRANWATYGDALCDYAADARIGTWNGTHFSDDRHPNALGYSIMAPILATAVQSI